MRHWIVIELHWAVVFQVESREIRLRSPTLSSASENIFHSSLTKNFNNSGSLRCSPSKIKMNYLLRFCGRYILCVTIVISFMLFMCLGFYWVYSQTDFVDDTFVPCWCNLISSDAYYLIISLRPWPWCSLKWYLVKNCSHQEPLNNCSHSSSS